MLMKRKVERMEASLNDQLVGTVLLLCSLNYTYCCGIDHNMFGAFVTYSSILYYNNVMEIFYQDVGLIFSIFVNSHSFWHRGQALRVLSQRWMQSK